MKQKDLIKLMVATVILSVAIILIVSQLGTGKKASKNELTYEKITKIDPEFKSDYLQLLTNPDVSRDFYSPPDLREGVGNTQPFSPLK